MIEVGEYVRTKDGKILKIDSFEKDLRNIEVVCFTTGEVYTREKLNEIIKTHSKNIIDIVELYDYVNGFIVFDIITRDNGEKTIQLMQGVLLEQDEIGSILTHEQFDSIKYKVEE